MINWALGHFVIALFVSILDRYFSGEDYKKTEWINGKSFKFKMGVSLVLIFVPFFVGGFLNADIFFTPLALIGLLGGFWTGEFFLKSYDWAFKKPAGAPAADKKDETADSGTGSGEKKDESEPTIGEDDKSRQSVVEAIQSAGSSIKEGLKSVGEGIAKASENVFSESGKDGEKKEGEPKEKKNYESNKKLDDKLNNY